MVRLFLIALCMLGLSGGQAYATPADANPAIATGPDEVTEQTIIFDRIKTAIAAKDFAGLSAMSDEFRLSRARFPDGVWKLAGFYVGVKSYLSDGLRREDGCKYRRSAFVRQWAKAMKNNPAPVIVNAELLVAQAWCFRGSGYANVVPPKAWAPFIKGIAAAYDTLLQHKDMASADPEYYAQMMTILRAMGADEPTFHDMLDEAIEREPGYHRTYFNAVYYYQPQWFGSYAAMDSFARYAAERTHDIEGSGMYARIFWSLDACECSPLENAADWSVMRQSMRDVFERYPVKWNATYFSELSCRMGDIEEGRRYLRAMHPAEKDESRFVAQYAACDVRAQRARAARAAAKEE